MRKKTIPTRYFDELTSIGHTVPRTESTGEVIPFTVGKTYNIGHYGSRVEVVKAKCTQDCPHALVLIRD